MAARETRVIVSAETSKYERGMRNVQMTSRRTSRAVSSAWKNVGTVFASIATLASGMLVKSLIAAANEQEAAEKRLEAVMKATGQAAGYTAEEMFKMAAEMQKVTTIGDEVSIAGMAILATFKKIEGEGFRRTMMAAADMSEVMQQDLKSSIVMIGKALNDPIKNLSAMTRAGVQFTDSQREMIRFLWKSGNAIGAQGIILKELETQFGGAAKAARNTFGGAMKAVGNAFGDFLEELGFIITKSENYIEITERAEKAFADWIDFIRKNQKYIEKIKDALGRVWDATKLLWKLLSSPPIGILNFFMNVTDEAKKASDEIGNLAKKVSDIKPPEQTTFTKFLTFLSKWGIDIVHTFTFIGEAIAVSFSGLIGDAIATAKLIGKEFLQLGEVIWKALTLDFKGARKAFGGFASISNDFLQEISINWKSYEKTILESWKKMLVDMGAIPPPVVIPLPVETEREKKKSGVAGVENFPKPDKEEWFGSEEVIRNMVRLTQEVAAQKLKTQIDFNEQYNELGKTQFDIERDQLTRQAELWEEAGLNKNRIDQLVSSRSIDIARAEQLAKLDIYQKIAGGIAGTFQQIAQAGGKQSREAFEMYKAFAMVQAGIAARAAVIGALGSPPYGIPAMVLAGVIGAAAAVQIAMIAASQPPSFDQGGISNAKGIYQTGNIAEAHIPIPSGGKIPVQVNNQQQPVQIIMQNPVFQDIDTQRQVMAQIAEIVATRVAPGAVVENYNDDGAVRSMVRGRA